MTRRHTRDQAQARVLAPGFGVSLLCHLLALVIFAPSLSDCGHGEDAPPVAAVDAFSKLQPEEEPLSILDEALVEARTPPEKSDPVKAPEEVPKAIDTMAPKKPEVAKKKPRNLKERRNLVVDQPLVEKESEPPPDTKVLGPQDRRVLQEVQPKRTALKPSKKAPEEDKPKLTADAAETKEKAEADKAPKRKEEIKGNPKTRPDKKIPGAKVKTDSKKVSDLDPSKAQKRRKKGDPGLAASKKVAPEGVELDKIAPEALAPNAGAPKESPKDEKNGDQDKPDGQSGDGAKFDVAAAMKIDPGMYNKMFGKRDAQDLRRVSATERRLLGRWEKRVKATRAALENFVPNVRYGNQIAINTRRSEYAVYIAGIHRKIHRRWGIAYLRHLDMHYPMGHPMSNPKLMATIEFAIDGKSGELKEATIVETSGMMEFDTEAIRIGYATAPHGPAPKAIVSPDGNVYLHWRFHRDTRQCGTFGVSVYVIEDDGRIDKYKVDEQLDGLNHHHPEGSKPHRGKKRAVDPNLISKPAPKKGEQAP